MTGGNLGRADPAGRLRPGTDARASSRRSRPAVASAHRHGVVHGRIRPENVLFDAEDNAFVADLGIDEICPGVITFASSAYDAPERLGGALATPASDVYSLGVLVEHLLERFATTARRGARRRRGSGVRRGRRRATDPDPAGGNSRSTS